MVISMIVPPITVAQIDSQISSLPTTTNERERHANGYEQTSQTHELVDYKHKLLLCLTFNRHNNRQRYEQRQVVKYKED